ncbi:hypothetical protein HDV01_007252 [Terramyces sp. JEL0728]|nr:hypothetical protein HDV01_007252 [Terramyces sp. JEL0728]
MNNFYSQIWFAPGGNEVVGLTEFNELLHLQDLESVPAMDRLELDSNHTQNKNSFDSNLNPMDRSMRLDAVESESLHSVNPKNTKLIKRIGMDERKACKFPDQIYSFDFYPYYSLSDQHKCFVISIKDHPPVLYDSVHYYQRQAYKTHLLGEQITPLTAKFNHTDLYFGFKNLVQVYDISGQEKESLKIQGLVSCMDFTHLNCIGTFNGLITLYQDGYTNYIKEPNGITQIKQKDNYIVYSMRNGGVSIYDARNLSTKLIERKAKNQRLYFDIKDDILYGDTDGWIREIDFSGNLINEVYVGGVVGSAQYGNGVIGYSVGTRGFMFDQQRPSFVGLIKDV